jgi:hypothetical protein
MDVQFVQQMQLCFCTHDDVYESNKVLDDGKDDGTSKIKSLQQLKIA